MALDPIILKLKRNSQMPHSFMEALLEKQGAKFHVCAMNFSVYSIRIKKAKLRKTKSLEKTALKTLPKSAAYSDSELLL